MAMNAIDTLPIEVFWLIVLTIVLCIGLLGEQ
jgi:hypothetical protein